MPAKILVHCPDREVGQLLATLLAQHRHEVLHAATPEESAQLAGTAGPMDLVLCLDGRPEAADLRVRLRELAPDTRLLQLPALRSAGDPDLKLDSPGVLLEATELIDMVEASLEAAERGHRAPAVTAESLHAALVETILTYSLLLEQFEHINGGNGRLIMEYSVRLARELGLSPTHCEEIGFAALLQDIGLVKNPSRSRSGGPDEAARRIREHPIRSANLIQRMRLPWKIRHIVLAHHEWYNGRGYPHGLKGRDIPLGARILAGVNAFFAMISRRPNRPALGKPEAFEELRRLAGRQFDPEVVEILLSAMKDKAYHEEKRRRIGIASADPTLGSLARARFDSAGRDAWVLSSGVEALARIKSEPPDALLLDAELADTSGYQLLHWLRADPELSGLPVVVVSGDPDRGAHAFMAHDMGADDFLEKPVRSADLVARVNAVLRRRDRLARAEFSMMHEGEGLRGSLEELSVPDLVAMLADGRKTATVNLFLPGGAALLAIDGGHIVHARTASAVGEAAVKEAFRAATGDFIIEHGAATAERSVDRRMDLLVAEALEERARAEAERAALAGAEVAACAISDHARQAAGAGPAADSPDADASDTVAIEVLPARESEADPVAGEKEGEALALAACTGAHPAPRRRDEPTDRQRPPGVGPGAS